MNKPDNVEQLKRAALLRMLQKRNSVRREDSALQAIAPADRSGPLPLSWAQQRLWFLDQLDSAAGAAYHLPACLRLRGPLQRAALQAALDRIVARHEDLRTTFVLVDGHPVQSIADPTRGFELVDEDLRACGPAAQDSVLEGRIKAELGKPFALSEGPLIRGCLLRLADDEHVLFIVQHHIVSDGWSTGVLLREISTLYAAFSQGQPDPLPPLPLQYADYAAWQRAWLQGDKLREQIDFWRGHLSGAPALLELPTDRPRPATQSHAGGRISLTLDTALAAGLRELSRRHGTTLFMTLLGAWAVLLARSSGQDEVVIGTPVANRQRSEIETLIGFFVNTLALRVKLGHDPDVAQLLAQVKETTLSAFSHQDLPFEQVVEALQPARSLGHSPIFQVMFSMNNTPGGADLTLPGLQLETLELAHSTTHFDLMLELADSGGEIGGALEYASDLFDIATVERLAERFQVLLTAMVADQQLPVSQLTPMSGAERALLVQSFNDTERDYPREQTIAQLFEAQAAATPAAIALVGDGQEIGYGELNARANRIAHHLLSLGVGPDRTVALCFERGVDMVVGMLAILKAGGAYVPLDPGYPAERLAHMLDDSAPVALLTNSVLLAKLPALACAAVLVDRDAQMLAAQPDSNPAARGEASHLAYVIYTSGSTGLPKGVMVEQRNVIQLAVNNTFAPLGAHDCVAHCANPAFDASTWEIWGALLVGARVLIIPQAVLLEPRQLCAAMIEGGVSATFLTVALLNQYADALAPLFPTLNYLLFGGEKTDLRKIKQVFREGAPRHLVHCYGPTETTTFATTLDIQELAEDAVSLPIGAPIGNARIYILDRHMHPVPLGVAGEIHVGGAGVARGYLNRDDLTAERFIHDPFSTTSGARMYKTGDLGRWLADGTVEYIGRNDFQVKIRGFRIELGEIEARLLACEGVKEAIVLARDDNAGEKRLVAYLVADSGAELSATALRTALSSVLPAYMVPGAYVTLDALPLTPNGKLDRRALPAPGEEALASRGYKAPEGELEAAIAALWHELLGMPASSRVGRDDHFFELGGHSLMVVGMIEQLRRQGYTADVRMVFASPTPATLATAIQNRPAAEAFVVAPNLIAADCAAITPAMLPLVQLTQQQIDTIVASVPGGAANVQDIYPLAPLQDGILFHHLLGGEGDAYLLRTVLSFDDRARLDGFLAAIQAVIDRHDSLRSAIRWQGLPQPVQVVCRRAPLPLITLGLDDASDALAQLLAATDPQALRMDLQQAPLLAAHIIGDTAGGAWHLALMAHHIICDHVTQELLLEEIEAVLQGQGALLPPPLPYRNFIARTRAVPAAAHEDYFRAQLGDIDEPTAPFGVLEVQHDDADVAQAQRALEPALALRIRREARDHGVTAAVLFHVAWAQVLALCTGRDDVVFGTVLSGRLQGSEGADRVFGLFINTLPVRIGLGAHDVREVVGQAYRSLGELLVHEQASLALAQRCSAVAPPLPLFTSLLNYRHSAGGGHAQDDAGHAFAWEGISVLPGEERSNYPLTISVDDMGEGFSLSAQCVPGIDPDRLLGYLHAAIDALVGALAQATPAPAAALAPLPASERAMLLHAFNDSARDYPREQTIAQLFEAQAALRPDAPALMHEGATLSYDELNRRANRLAHHLLALGVRPEQAVALCFERSVEMVVGMLAVLKAGGAYLPLDPAYPAERLAHMLGDSAPVALLTNAALLADLPAPACPVVLLDHAQAALAARPETNPSAEGRHPGELAYIMYTSGSTGLPKGVMVEQRNVVQLVVNNTFAPIGSGDCMAHCANPAFDAATWEIWGALLVGARVLIISQAVLLDPPRLCAEMIAGAVSATFLTSALFSQYADALAPLFPTLNYLLVGGDALEANKVRQVLRNNAPRHLVNGYGPTETTTFACAHEVGALAPAARSVPIGAPIGNAQVYILDRHLQPVPLGVAGEIYIGGAGVARGYLNRDDLTAERFIADPFSAVAGARMYKTGDLGRWLADGTVDCMGRNDFQVKIRGYRIELGEIEARLLACEGVKAAVVLVREDEPGDKRLVAYLVAQDGSELSATALRAALSGVMPAYMVPGAYVILDAFPLTPNGKLDRRALPSPDGEALASRVYEAPEGAREIAIAAIWAQLLGVERIGRHDQFFELGGHSLLAVQLLSSVREALGVEVALRTLFVQPTLAAFAASLECDAADARHPNLVPIRPRGELAPLFLIHPGEGEVGYARDMAAWLHAPRPLYALAASGFMAGDTPQGTVEEMAARYIAAIRSVQPHGPYHVAGWSAGGTIAYEMANQLIGADETVAFLGLIDTVRDYRALVRSGAVVDEHGVAGFDPVAELLFRLGGELAPALSAQLAQLAGAGDFGAMLALCQQEGLMPPDLDAGIVRRHLHVAHAIREAVFHYGPQPLPCSVSLFVAKDEQHADPLLGWGELAGERLALARVDGDHQSMMEAPHIGVLARALDAALARAGGRSASGQEQDYRPAILIQSGPAHVKPLFCVPGAGASVTAFTGLALTLDLNMPIYGLQPRGLDGIRVPHVDVPSAARAYLRAVREISPSGPYHLLGHSFGGWVALEMARQLAASGERVGSLIVLDSRAPGQASPARYTRVGMLLRLVELFEMSAGRSMKLRAADLAGLDHEAQLALLLRRLIGVKLMPASTGIQLIRGLVRVFETNLNTGYAPEGSYPHPVHLVNVAGEDPDAQCRRENALAGWRRLAPQASVWQSEGNHMTLLSRPHVDALAAWLRPILKGQA